MKKEKIILISQIIFIALFIIVVVFFTLRYLFDRLNENKIRTALQDLITEVNKYDKGTYTYENSSFRSGNNIIDSSINFEGTGEFIKNNYGVSGKLENKKFCFYLGNGNTEILKYDKCKEINLNNEDIKYTQMGAKVTLSIKKFYYKVTNNKNVPKDWEKSENEELIISLPFEGKFYIWSKTEFGAINEPIEITINCSSGEFNDISSSLIYCVGSKINYNNYSWHVISDQNGETKLLMDSSQLSKMSHCESEINELCYYKSDIIFSSYKWSDSKVNKYLNTEFIKLFNEDDLITSYICDIPSGKKGCNDGDGCGGYLKEDVKNNNYKCDSYTESKIRLLTYEEYKELINKNIDTKWIYNGKTPDFWLMNSYFEKGYYVSKINALGQYYMDEYSNNLLDIRPVIIVKK